MTPTIRTAAAIATTPARRRLALVVGCTPLFSVARGAS
jgi:hypothetical protein